MLRNRGDRVGPRVRAAHTPRGVVFLVGPSALASLLLVDGSMVDGRGGAAGVSWRHQRCRGLDGAPASDPASFVVEELVCVDRLVSPQHCLFD